jgi:xylan 1,4-beta-xylosidase
MGIAAQIRNMNDAFAVIARFPELRQTPIVIGESDPEGCAACQGNQLGYRNGTMYSSYTAASFAREYELADRHGVNLDAALTWAFTFENQPPFAGFRQLATCGIDLPVLNVFRMFSRMSGVRVATTSDLAVPLDAMIKSGVRKAPDIGALAALGSNQLAALVWHYHDDDVPGPAATVTLNLTNLPLKAGALRLEQFRVDEEHANAFTEWRRLGCPSSLTETQRQQLEAAGKLSAPEIQPAVKINNGTAKVEFSMPRQGVSLLLFTWR